MLKSIVSWIIALFIGLLVVWMFWTLFVPLIPFFDKITDNLIMFAIIIFIVSIPFYMIVRKKLIK